MLKVRGPTFAICLLLTGCGHAPKEVSDPFYLDYIEDPRAVELRRCLGEGCAAVEGLPDIEITANGEVGLHLIAAGANHRFITVLMMNGDALSGQKSYYYFARVPEEKYGWGNNPEKIIGPLSASEFAAAQRTLRLPPLTVRP